MHRVESSKLARCQEAKFSCWQSNVKVEQDLPLSVVRFEVGLMMAESLLQVLGGRIMGSATIQVVVVHQADVIARRSDGVELSLSPKLRHA